jgi:hypothetical protein
MDPTAMLIEEEKPAEVTRQSLFEVGTAALRRWQVLAGSLDPNPHADMAPAMQRNSSITRARRAVSGLFDLRGDDRF